MSKGTAVVLMVSLAFLGGFLAATTGAIADARVRKGLVTLQERYLPRVKLGPKLDAKLDKISRGFQDAVAAHDVDTLSSTHMVLDELSEMLASAQPSISASDAGAVRNAVKAFYTIGAHVTRRLMANETGEPIVAEIQEMQEAEKRAIDAIAAVTTVDAEALDTAFGEIIAAQHYSTRMRLTIIIGFFSLIVSIGFFLMRHFRSEEQRNDALLQLAWRELEALSSARAERPETIDMSQLVRDCGTLLRTASPDRALELDVQEGVRIDAEPALVRLLVEALLKNAMKVTEGRSSRIAFGELTLNGEVCCFIRDNGAWLGGSTARNVFASQAAFGGLRSGRPELATAQRVVRRCGGRIWAESAGEGSTVYFCLPTTANHAS